MEKLTVLDNHRLLALLANPGRLKGLPRLSELAQGLVRVRAALVDCPVCQRGRRLASQTLTLESIKSQIATLPDAEKLGLKRLLQARTVRIRYRSSAGQQVVLTF